MNDNQNTNQEPVRSDYMVPDLFRTELPATDDLLSGTDGLLISTDG